MTIQQLTEEEKCPKSSWSMFYKLCVDRFCGKMQSRVINTRLKQNEINDISQQQQQQQQQQVVKYPHISRAWFLDTRLFFIVITRLWWALLETTSQLVSAEVTEVVYWCAERSSLKGLTGLAVKTKDIQI